MSKERPWEAGPFEQWVIDELDYRKSSLSTGIQGQFKGDLPQYAGPRKAWARVFSNGMVEYPNGNPNLISDNDNEWGLAFLSGDGFFNRYGIGSTPPYGVSKQVYGYNCKLQPKYIDASTRPNVPDPGIISIETEIQKSWFARAKINWTVHSIEQLKAITPYFLTPLQSVIIEFGWNTFDQRSLINLSDFNQILDIWDNHYRRYSLFMPPSKGNYEFIIGQVVNFEYTINDNIINGMTEVASRQLLYSGFRKDSRISKQSTSISTFKRNYKILVDNIVNSFTSTDNQGNNSAQFQVESLLQGLENKYGGASFPAIKDHIFSGRNRQKIKYSHERDFDNNNKKGEEFTWLTMDLIVDILNGMKNSDGIKDYTEYFFDLNVDDITIGAHDNLISIKETILIPNPNAPKLNSPYNIYLQNSYQPNPEDAAGGILDNTNFFGFTKDEINNITASGISGVGNLNNAYTDKTKHKFFKPTYLNAHSELISYDKSKLADKQLRNATGASTQIHRQDLDFILNVWGRESSIRNNTAIPTTDPKFNNTRTPDGLKRGYLKNIYVNLKFLKETLLSEQNNNIKEVYDVICSEINKASCNFWELTVVDAPVKNGKSTLKIVDGKGPPNKNDANKIYKFEYMTNNSIIKKLNFTTNLSNAQANQIIFKAGTYDYTTSNQLLDYTNATNLPNSNKPEVVYSDRIIKTKAGKKELKQTKPSVRLNKEDIEYYYKLIGKDGKKYNDNESIKFLQVTLFDEKINPNSRTGGADTIVDYETYDIVDIIMPFEDLVLYMLNDGDLKTNTNIYNAPLRNVEIEMSLMGISGIKTFEFFRISNLPPPFNDDVVVFQVMNVTHVVNENTWETRIKAQLRPAYNLLP
jgi:hypothetical protein